LSCSFHFIKLPCGWADLIERVHGCAIAAIGIEASGGYEWRRDGLFPDRLRSVGGDGFRLALRRSICAFIVPNL
jgi:hypothetical protein